MDHDEIRKIALLNEKLISASIELTETCNLSCLHCYIADEKGVLSLPEVKLIIDKLYELNVLYLTFTGGEVFSCSFFCEAYLYAKSKGFIINILTNGTLLNSKIKKTLKEYKPYNVSVTVYGLNPEEYIHFTGKDRYRNLIDCLDFFDAEEIDFDIKTVLVKSNIKSAMKGKYEVLAKKYKKEMRYDPIIFGKKDGNKSSIYERLSVQEIVNFESLNESDVSFWKDAILKMKSEKEIRCGGGISGLSIDAKGFVSICSLFVTEKHDFLESTNDEVVKFLKEAHSKMQGFFKRSPCYKCDKKTLCKWCAAYANLEHGNCDSKISFFCNLAERRINQFHE